MHPDTFNEIPVLSEYFKIVATSKDRDGKLFISIIEGKSYPFYGF